MDINKLAERIFSAFGLKIETAVRAGGWTNAVWFNQDMVLRLSLAENSNKIRRELQLSGLLCDKIGYPANIATGVMEGYEWSISQRIEGVNLSEVWPKLSWKERTLAAKQLRDMIKEVHSVKIEQAQSLSSNRPWYSALDEEETTSRFKYYIEKGIFTPKEGSAMLEILARFWDEFALAKPVLNHGDITKDNILWKDGKIVSLLDFEHSVIAPAAVDLNSYINLLFFDNDNYIGQSNDAEFQRYKLEIKKLLYSDLEDYSSRYLLSGIAILYYQRFLEFWIKEQTESLEDFFAYKRLISFTEHPAGYFSEIFAW